MTGAQEPPLPLIERFDKLLAKVQDGTATPAESIAFYDAFFGYVAEHRNKLGEVETDTLLSLAFGQYIEPVRQKAYAALAAMSPEERAREKKILEAYVARIPFLVLDFDKLTLDYKIPDILLEKKDEPIDGKTIALLLSLAICAIGAVLIAMHSVLGPPVLGVGAGAFLIILLVHAIGSVFHG